MFWYVQLLEDVYMRPEMKSTQNEISTDHKRILFTLIFIAGEVKWISFRGSHKIKGPLSKSQSFLFAHVQMFPFIWFHFRFYFHNILSPEMKFRFCQNDRNNTHNKFHFRLYRVNSPTPSYSKVFDLELTQDHVKKLFVNRLTQPFCTNFNILED